MDLDFLRAKSASYHLMHMAYKINGPVMPDRAYLFPNKGLMMGFADDERTKSGEKEFEPHHFQLSKFLNNAARSFSPMPPAWIAVVGDTGYVFKPDSDGSWFYALAVATQHKLADMSKDSYRKKDYRKPTITFVPFEQDGMAGPTKFAYKVADLPPTTRACIEEEPRTYKVADLPAETRAYIEAESRIIILSPEMRAFLEKDLKRKGLLSRLELIGSASAPGHYIYKIKGEEKRPQE
ncbi:hypothetical protein ACHAPX_008498 [Trichoderma viride]